MSEEADGFKTESLLRLSKKKKHDACKTHAFDRLILNKVAYYKHNRDFSNRLTLD